MNIRNRVKAFSLNLPYCKVVVISLALANIPLLQADGLKFHDSDGVAVSPGINDAPPSPLKFAPQDYSPYYSPNYWQQFFPWGQAPMQPPQFPDRFGSPQFRVPPAIPDRMPYYSPGYPPIPR